MSMRNVLALTCCAVGLVILMSLLNNSGAFELLQEFLSDPLGIEGFLDNLGNFS